MQKSLLDLQRMVRFRYPILGRYHMSNNTGSRIQLEASAREMIQLITLLGLSKSDFFKNAAFYGGTAIRILYGLDRFSEDMDFTLLRPHRSSAIFDMSPFLEAATKELKNYGLEMKAEQKGKTATTDVVSAFLKLNTTQYCLAIGDIETAKKTNHNQEIKIKMEIDTNPPDYRFTTQKSIINAPERFIISSIDISELFAGKMHAALYRQWKNRVKGRDWYDVIWYINRGTPLNLNFFDSCMQQAKSIDSNIKSPFTRNKIIDMVKERIVNIDWENAKRDVLPFISEIEQLDNWSIDFFYSLIEKIVVK